MGVEDYRCKLVLGRRQPLTGFPVPPSFQADPHLYPDAKLILRAPDGVIELLEWGSDPPSIEIQIAVMQPEEALGALWRFLAWAVPALDVREVQLLEKDQFEKITFEPKATDLLPRLKVGYLRQKTIWQEIAGPAEKVGTTTDALELLRPSRPP